MKTFAEFVAKKREITITVIAKYMQHYIQESIQSSWKEQYEENFNMYQEINEAAYGVFGRAFFKLAHTQFTQAGFTVDANMFGNLSTSLEQWGPPEERERCMWSVVKRGAEPIGTLVVRFFHDHTQFRLPYIPDVLALKETEHNDIVQALLDPSVRLQHFIMQPFEPDAGKEQKPLWEYAAEYGLGGLRNRADHDMLEYASYLTLEQWSRHGWELINVVPDQGQMVAFFRRPVQNV